MVYPQPHCNTAFLLLNMFYDEIRFEGGEGGGESMQSLLSLIPLFIELCRKVLAENFPLQCR